MVDIYSNKEILAGHRVHGEEQNHDQLPMARETGRSQVKKRKKRIWGKKAGWKMTVSSNRALVRFLGDTRGGGANV